MSITTAYTVAGMTCSHCVNAVTEEVRALDGVRDVQVDLDSGSLTVTSDGDLSFAAVADAVDEAGYTLASSAQLSIPPVPDGDA